MYIATTQDNEPTVFLNVTENLFTPTTSGIAS